MTRFPKLHENQRLSPANLPTFQTGPSCPLRCPICCCRPSVTSQIRMVPSPGSKKNTHDKKSFGIFFLRTSWVHKYTSSHNHGSQKWVPPIVVTFQYSHFPLPWLWEREYISTPWQHGADHRNGVPGSPFLCRSMDPSPPTKRPMT